MWSVENGAVMRAVMDECSRAYQSRTPLIMLDTVEYELAEAVALSGRLVGLARRAERYTGKELAYYEFAGARPDRITGLANLFFDLEGLEKAGGSLDEPRLPVMTVLALENGGRPPRAAAETIDALRRYVRRYLACRDDSSPLRCSCVLLYGDTSLLTEELQPYTEIVEIGFPDKRELRAMLDAMSAADGRSPLEDADAQEVVSSLAGLGLYEAKRLIFRLLSVRTERGVRLIDSPELRRGAIRDMKKQSLLRNGGLLTLCQASETRLGGMEAYKDWVAGRRDIVLHPEEYLLRNGATPPKGVLLCGVPGCGKSEAAKTLQWEWQLPRLQLSVDQLMGSYVGDSERNMRTALRQAEAMAPCILWIDELDKGFSAAASGGNGDRGGTFKRMFARLLTWMQEENDRGCFIFATANDISELPPEFFRKGRFDELFSVFMPTSAECRAIFAEHMRRAEERRADEIRSRYGDGFAFTPLFANSETVENEADYCYSEKYCLGPIMEIFAENRKFLTGGDIEYIVKCALLRLGEEGSLPVKASRWVKEIRRVADDANLATYGCGSGGLDSIAACCLRLLRNNFVPAGASPMFERGNLRVTHNGADGRMQVRYELPEGAEPPADAYDRALYEALVSRFERIASRMESSALDRLCRG